MWQYDIQFMKKEDQSGAFFNKRQAIRYVFLSALMILAAYSIWFKVWWAKGPESNLGIVSFLMAAIAAFFLSMSLTRLFIPPEIDFSFSTFGTTNKDSYKRFADRIGTKKAGSLTNICILFYILFTAVPAFIFYTKLNSYEQFQLNTYGETQRVRIKDIEAGKSGPYVSFDFYFSDTKYSDRLKLGNKKGSQGDEISIIFSRNNPDIVQWEEDYLEEK